MMLPFSSEDLLLLLIGSQAETSEIIDYFNYRLKCLEVWPYFKGLACFWFRLSYKVASMGWYQFLLSFLACHPLLQGREKEMSNARLSSLRIPSSITNSHYMNSSLKPLDISYYSVCFCPSLVLARRFVQIAWSSI